MNSFAENKENDYHHLVQVSPEKPRKTHRHANIMALCDPNAKLPLEDCLPSKKRRQL